MKKLLLSLVLCPVFAAPVALAMPLPPPGEHPRIFFNADELPWIRERMANSTHGKVAGERIERFRKDIGKWKGLAQLDDGPPPAGEIELWFKQPPFPRPPVRPPALSTAFTQKANS